MRKDFCLYNKYNKPIAASYNGRHVCLINLEPVAILDRRILYSLFTGEFLGWFRGSYLFDRSGKIVFIAMENHGKSKKHIAKHKIPKGAEIPKPCTLSKHSEDKPIICREEWSDYFDENFFRQ